jgi:hypothetical protein
MRSGRLPPHHTGGLPGPAFSDIIRVSPARNRTRGAATSSAQVVKLVDAGDSKSPAARRAGSIPALGTKFSSSKFPPSRKKPCE